MRSLMIHQSQLLATSFYAPTSSGQEQGHLGLTVYLDTLLAAFAKESKRPKRLPKQSRPRRLP